MKRMLISLFTLFIFGFFPRLAIAEELMIENPSIEIDDALVVNATIEVSFGDITLTGGATKLMEGEFRYSSLNGNLISYQVKNMVGELKVEIPANINFSLFSFRDKSQQTL